MAGQEGLAPRRAAFAVLRGVREGRTFEGALDDALAGMAGADRRLAHELAAGALRQRAALDARLAPLARRGWDAVPADLQDVLRLGAYQLDLLDRIPPHAAVHATVALARELGGRPAAGFVNALLRRLAASPVEPAPGTTGPGSGSLPPWLEARWIGRWGAEGARALAAHADRRPVPVLQPARAGLEELAAALERAGVPHEPLPWGTGLAVPGARPAALPGYGEGHFMVQDPAQALVARFAAPAPGTLVYDACAAPGGKAIALGRTAALVLAGDRSWRRVQRLAENLERAGSGREHAVLADATAAPLRQADLVLLDAPCLGTGTLARRPDVRWRLGPDALARVVTLQRDLLAALAPLVSPGGVLVYSTCSLEPEENEEQVDDFLVRHPGFVREPGPAAPAHRTAEGDLLLLPHRDGTDGAYAARLRRVP